jgi:hypothetical protein
MQVNPSQPFTIDFFITDHTDAGTYYCQGVIYDATSGDILATHNLTQMSTNSRLFSKRVQAPGDPSGQGRRIVVVATAYEDSAHTIKSENYQEQSEAYFVKQEQNVFGGGGGVDYRMMKEIIEKVIEEKVKIPKQKDIIIPETKFPAMPFNSILELLGRIQSKIEKIPTEKTDMQPNIDALHALFNEVRAIEIPETNLQPIEEKLKDIESQISEFNQNIHEHVTGKVEHLKNTIPEMVHANTQKTLGEANFNLSPMQMKMNVETPKPKPLPDISHLMKK